MALGAAKESNMTQRLNNINIKEEHSAIKNKGMLREKKQISENKYVMEITNSIDILEIRLGNLSEGTAEKMKLQKTASKGKNKEIIWSV